MDDSRTTEFMNVAAVLPLYEYLSLTHARLNNVQGDHAFSGEHTEGGPKINEFDAVLPCI